jgi:FAD:protein FMN transferase
VNRVAVPQRLDPDAADPPSGPVLTLGGPTMGVHWSVQACPPPGVSAGAMHRAVQAAVNRVVLEMSDWEPDSALSRFNRAPAGSRHGLPSGLLAVLTRALHWAEESDGAFDPTLGALTELWGFGPSGEQPTPRSGDWISQAPGGWRSLTIRDDSLLQPGGLELDLSGIAKGYGVDVACEALLALGVRHFLVEIGGELRGAGVQPDGQPWWVAIETPPGLTVDEPVLVALHGLALATSGDYRRFRMDSGRRQSHTLDPRTGAPLADAPASVSVLAETCMDADALCTVLSVMGPDEGLTWAADRNIAALYQLRGEAGLDERMTPAFAVMLTD